jgi:hypothetical protein
VPLWVIVAVAGVLLLAIYTGLGGVSGPVAAQLNTLSAEDKIPSRPTTAPTKPAELRMTLTQSLREDVQRKLIEVWQGPRQATIIIRGQRDESLFGSGQAIVNPPYVGLLA